MVESELVQRVYARALENPQRIAVSEATDEKMMRAAYKVAQGGWAHCVLVGSEAELRVLCEERDLDQGLFVFADTGKECAEKLAERYLALPDVTLSERALARKMRDSLYFAMVLEAVGDVDAVVGGLDAATADVIQAALDVFGMEEGAETVSSVSICEIPGFEGPQGPALACADVAVCPDPDASQLASIAISSCDTVKALTGWDPRCAMLSFSTDGSAAHDLVDKVVEATEIAQSRRPDLKIDGEFQLDSAIEPSGAAKKVLRPSEVAGKANILVFPDLNAGNIGAKILNKIAHAQFYGVMLQGFKRVCSDASRTSSVDELARNIVFTAARAAGMNDE